MKTCTYDNPATMARECWQDGKLICSYSAKLLSIDRAFHRRIFMGANVGDWKAGQYFGDLQAIGEGQ